MKEVNLIIAAMDEEVQALLDNLPNYEVKTIDDNTAYEFKIRDENFVLVKGKIGKVYTSIFLSRLALILKIKRVFNIGTSGGVNKGLKINDVIVATKVGYHDVDVTFFNYEIGQIPGDPRYYECDNEFVDSRIIDPKYSIKRGIILSGDSFVTRENINSKNINVEECLACEMESASVGQTCSQLKIPFVVIRSISDLTFEQIDVDNHNNDVVSSSTNSALVLLELIK